MNRVAFIHLFKVTLLVALLVAGTIFGIAAWMLRGVPRDVDFLIPAIENAIFLPSQGYRISVEGLKMSWPGLRQGLDLHVANTRVHDILGKKIVELPELRLKLSLRQLLRGHFSPHTLELSEAQIHLRRDRGGGVSLAIPSADYSRKPLADNVPVLIEALNSNEHVVLEAFRFLRIVDAELVFDDVPTGKRWVGSPATVEVIRGRDGDIEGKVSSLMNDGKVDAVLDLNFGYLQENQTIDVGVSVSDFDLEMLSGIVPLPESVLAWEGEIDATTSLLADSSGVLRAMDFEIQSGPGTFTAGAPFALAEAFQYAELRGSFDPDSRTVHLHKLSLTVGAQPNGPRLSGKGHAVLLKGGAAIELDLSTENLGIEDLFHFWPPALVTKGREWVLMNIDNARLDASASLNLQVTSDPALRTKVRSVDGRLRFSDLALSYLKDRPPLRGVRGTAHFDFDEISFVIDRGSSLGLDLRNTRVVLDGLAGKNERASIETDLSGAARGSHPSNRRRRSSRRIWHVAPFLKFDGSDLGEGRDRVSSS